MKKVLHMIGNAHIDPVWLWRWQDGFSEIRSTFRSVLDRMNEYPDFIFTSAAASYYEWVEKNDPEMFGQIQARVREGRWHIVGGWWIQPDCNIPSGESFARQALYAQRYFKEKFGITARTGYNVDSFGHTGSLPKILRMSGMENYVFMRPGVHEKNYPAWTFTWQSPEGDEVTAFRVPFEYCTWGNVLPEHAARCAGEICNDNGMMCFYGVGNHGGGPTKENLDTIAAINGKDGVEMRLSSPDQYFEGLAVRDLPVVNGDLLHHASGCYAAHSGVKRWNRQAESRLISAEKWSSAAHALLGKPYPREEYTKAWKKVLFNQFHDILAGASIREAYEDAREDFGYALSVGAEHMNDAQQAIAGHIGVPFTEGAFTYVVFNPQSFQAQWPVRLEVQNYKPRMRLVDGQDHEIPWQLTEGSAAAMGRKCLNFIADVPAMGWQTYRMLPVEGEPEQTVMDEAPVLENAWVRAEFDAEKGLASLFFKTTQAELLREPLQALVVDDPSDTWSHAILRFDRVAGAMSLKNAKVVQDGPVLKTVRCVYTYGESLLTADFTLYRELPQILMKCTLDWREKQKILKLHYPLKYRYSHVCAQAPFGYADRLMDGEEYPMQQWVDLTGVAEGDGQPVSGLAVLNDCKYAYSAYGGALDITVARSPYYANHEPFVVTEDMEYPTVDWGMQRFELALLPHTGAFFEGGVEQAAMLLNAPVTILTEGAHDGSLAMEGSLLTVKADHVVADAIKLAEDSDDELIVHLHEVARRAETAKLFLCFAKKEKSITMRAGEIKALRVSLKDGTVTETDLIEMKR